MKINVPSGEIAMLLHVALWRHAACKRLPDCSVARSTASSAGPSELRGRPAAAPTVQKFQFASDWMMCVSHPEVNFRCVLCSVFWAVSLQRFSREKNHWIVERVKKQKSTFLLQFFPSFLKVSSSSRRRPLGSKTSVRCSFMLRRV